MNDPYDPYSVNADSDHLRDAPLPPGVAPPVLLWFRIYAGLLAALYGFLFLMGMFIVVAGASGEMGMNEGEALIIGAVYTVMGAVLGGAYVVGAVCPRRGWTWIFVIVLLALSMTSLCCLPAAIPILIYWIKPETKHWFMGD